MDSRPTVRIDLTPQQQQMICEATGILEITLQRFVDELNAPPPASVLPCSPAPHSTSP